MKLFLRTDLLLYVETSNRRYLHGSGVEERSARHPAAARNVPAPAHVSLIAPTHPHCRLARSSSSSETEKVAARRPVPQVFRPV